MIVGFSKLFADIIHSTVWREPMHVKVVWITMLAMADRHGQVFASIPGLADSAKVSLEECIEALEVFSSPDKYSRTKDYEGRRIVEIDGGWLLLNYEKFRERRDDEEQRIQTRDRVRRHREKAKALSNDVTESVTETRCNDIAEADTDTEQNTDVVSEIFEFWKSTMTLNQKTLLTPKRRKVIKDRIKQGYTIERIKNAIVGCSLSPFHNGQNDTNTKYNDIELICRSGEKVEFFEQKLNDKPPSLPQEELDARAAVRAGMEAMNGR
jgi:hypothetical protein